MSLVLLFPGQSSRYPGMVPKFASLHAKNCEVMEFASEILGRDLLDHYREDNPHAYASNQDVQIGVFLANHMALQVLEASGIEAQASLGLSLGEWNHLVHIGAIEFETALRTVEYRGLVYDDAPRGAMASVFPIELEELQKIVERAAEGAVLEVANRNSPRQQVLSGEVAALERAMAILEQEHYVSAEVIEPNVPMHSSLFQESGERFRRHLEKIEFKTPRLPYLPNRLGSFSHDSSLFPELLSTHLFHPVEWCQSVNFMVEKLPDAVFLEVGPRAVLHNLFDRKWHKNIKKMKMDDRHDVRAHQQRLLSELRDFIH